MEVMERHIGAYGIIIRDNKIALVRKARGGYKGKLDLPGGGMEHGETPIDTLKRELMEEINGTVVETTLLDATSVNIKWQVKHDLVQDLHHIGILFEVKISEDKLKEDADGLDSEGADWYIIDELNESDVSPFVWYSLKLLKFK